MAQSKKLKNVLRRVRTFNKKFPHDALNVEAIKSRDNLRSLEAVERKIEKIRLIHTYNSRSAAMAHEINEIDKQGHVYESASAGHKFFEVTPRKTLQGATNQYLKTQQTLKESKAFKKSQDKFIADANEYNRQLKGKHSQRFTAIPRTREQIKEYRKALKQLKKDQLDEARETLHIPKGADIRRALTDRDAKEAKYFAGFTYHDRIYLQNIMDHVSDSVIPELEDLFIRGGESLVLELSSAGFTMTEWYDPDKTLEDVRGNILEKLAEAAQTLNPRNKKLVEDFIDSIEAD